MIYNEFKERLLNGEYALTSDTIKVALLTSTYVPDTDAHDSYADLTNEVVGTGYTAGGQQLTTPTVTEDTTNDRGVFDADNVVWTGSTITARYGVIYRDSGTASTSYLIACVDFGSDYSSTNGDFTISWDSAGILYIG